MPVSFSKNIAHLESSIDYTFEKKSLLKEALTHRSFAHENPQSRSKYNERLEYLGDAVLELIISEYLYSSYLDCTEAELSKIKAYVVQEASLAESARRLNIGDHLLLGKGEELTGGRQKPSLLADAFEAVLAAIYLDGGYGKAKQFALSNLVSKIDELAQKRFVFDFKTMLQEISQARYGVLPKYVIHKEEGPEHKKTFEVRVYIRRNFLGSGTGRTKKAAAQKAAEMALKEMEDRKR